MSLNRQFQIPTQLFATRMYLDAVGITNYEEYQEGNYLFIRTSTGQCPKIHRNITYTFDLDGSLLSVE